MSLLSSRRSLELAIGPTMVCVRVRRGWAWGRGAADERLVAERSPQEPLAETIERLLARAAEAAGCARFRRWPARVEIGNALAHFDVVEGDFSGLSDPALAATAHACVQDLLGPGHGRETRWHLQADERHLLVCAIDGGLLADLHRVGTAQGLHWRHIETAFGIDWNLHGRRTAVGMSVFVSRSADEATSALVRDGIVVALGHCPQPDRAEHLETATLPEQDLADGAGGAVATSRLDAQVGRMVRADGSAIGQVGRFVAVAHSGTLEAMTGRWNMRIQRETTG